MKTYHILPTIIFRLQMALSQTQRKALQQARATLPAEPIGTFIESLFPADLSSQRKVPFVDAANNLFTKHWTRAVGQEVTVPSQDSLNLVTCTCAKLQLTYSVLRPQRPTLPSSRLTLPLRKGVLPTPRRSRLPAAPLGTLLQPPFRTLLTSLSKFLRIGVLLVFCSQR